MNRNKLKTYAPKARRDFIAAVTARAIKFGISKDAVEPVQVQGNVALIAGQAHPKKVADQRAKLESRIKTRGFEQVMEEAAYTWFNRFAAIRYMEVHGYLDHGYRVLSHPEGKATPEIVEHAQHLDLPGLDKEMVIELKLDGTKEGDLYRMLLMAQCNALNAAMPFLFKRIDDETELLLPDNLLHSDSVIRQMVNEIEETDWQEIEIIGWLYQFYISEKKDQVIGKVVKSEDIPAATQLFTPNWIVKYMVQNTLGAKWLATYPQSGIRAKMEYYIDPAEQTDEVKAKLATITPKELNIEEITFLDPACGSGHILVEAYDLFKDIYLERGYVLRDVPRLILEKNLFGLDIDDRAAQMAAFALLMKARADDRRVFDRSISMNVMAIQDSKGLDANEICAVLVPDERFELVPSYDLLPDTLPQPKLSKFTGSNIGVTLRSMFDVFADGKMFGSLLMMPKDIQAEIKNYFALDVVTPHLKHDLFAETIKLQAIESINKLIIQSKLMSKTYDCVVANPPYMGAGAMNGKMKEFSNKYFPSSKGDLFAMFIEQGLRMTRVNGLCSMVTMESWIYLKSYEQLRNIVNDRKTIVSMCHFPYEGKKPTAMGINFGITCFSIMACKLNNFTGLYQKFRHLDLMQSGEPKEFKDKMANSYRRAAEDFRKVPLSPICYTASDVVISLFSKSRLSAFADARKGMVTANNSRFIRYWHEVNFSNIGIGLSSREEARSSSKKWFPYMKGGDFRKWYGNQESVVNWLNDGHELLNMKSEGYKVGSTNHNLEYIFKPAITWTKVTSAIPAFRINYHGYLYDDASGLCAPTSKMAPEFILGILNSLACRVFIRVMSETININPGNLANIPIPSESNIITDKVKKLVELAKTDWDRDEVSFDFQSDVLVKIGKCRIVEAMLAAESVFDSYWMETFRLECEVNAMLVDEYGLEQDSDLIASEGEVTFRRVFPRQEIINTISFSVGCMMGRYSLDEPGLIYANSGNVGFDSSRYTTFPADDDGIVPIMQTDWFDDDASNRFVEFLKVAWSPETLTENLKFVADSLGAKSGELPIDTIRRYLSTDFFKDHLKTYKKRPIYWLFSSGKEKAFEALVYLHRYNEGTLSRMRMEYVTPLQGRIASRIDQLGRDIDAAASTAAQNKLRKEQEKLKKQQAELVKFDEELRHYADMRIKLDLDDGVKVNYGKFGNLLAETKAITGGSDE